MRKINIEAETIGNDNFRKVIFTGKNLQLVLMSLKPGEKIGGEVHRNVDQFFRIEKGIATIFVGGITYFLKDGDALVVPAGNYHDVLNRSSTKYLKLYTIYAPPNHPAGLIEKKKPVECHG